MDRIELNDIDDIKSISRNINDDLDLEIAYSSNFSNTQKLRDIVNDIFTTIKLNPKDVYKIILIIDEMNNNAIEYGSSAGEINKMRLKGKKVLDKFELFIEVEDTGNGKESKNASLMEEIKEQKLEEGYLKYHSIRGRGLFLIIINLVDNLYFKNSDSGGLIVGIKKVLELNN